MDDWMELVCVGSLLHFTLLARRWMGDTPEQADLDKNGGFDMYTELD